MNRPGLLLALLLAVAAAEGYFGGAGTGPLFGAGLRVAGDHGRHLGWSADLVYHGGGPARAVALGGLRVDCVRLGAALLGHLRVGAVWLRAGAGARAGAARVAGTPDSPDVVGGALFGPFAGPLVALSAGASPGRLALELAVEGGYAVASVTGRAAGVAALSVAGPFLGVQLGVGVRP